MWYDTGRDLVKVEPRSSLLLFYPFTPLLLHLTLSPTLSFLHGGIIQYLIPDLLLLPASWWLHARPTHPLCPRDRPELPVSSPPCSRRMPTSSVLQPTTAQTLQPSWTGSPARVGGAAASIDSSGTRPRRTAILLLSPRDQLGFPTSTSRCCLPFGMQAWITPGPSLARCRLFGTLWSQ